jgi:putative ABC transport system permease protein
MTTLLQDIKFALRSFRKSPGFTLTALLTVALGIGANTAIFSVVNGVLLRPLPFAEPDRLVLVGHRYKSIHLETGTSAIGFLYYHEQSKSFEHSAGFTGWEANLARGAEPERLVGQQVTSEYFATLGIPMVAGRGFTKEEEEQGKDKVVVLSEGLWTREFGRDRSILNQPLVVNGEAHTVVGVAREGFRFGTDATSIWKPLTFSPDQRNGCWGCEFMGMLARLKPGVTPEALQSDLDRLSAQVRGIPNSFRDTNWGLYSKSATEQVVGNVRPALLVLMGAVGFVLLIACANLANLMLARATARQREIAIRTAMGAGRGRLVRQLLTESVLLSGIGGALGLLLASLAVKALVASNPINLPRLDSVGINGTVLLFTGGVTILLGLLFGLAPAVQAARPAVHGMLKDGVRSSHQGGRLRATLVVSEVTLAIVLLIGSGLMLKSFRHWIAVDPGFRPERVLTFGVSLPNSKYGTREQQIAFFDQLRRGIAALPGVTAVGGNVALPMSNANWTRSFQVEGYQPPPKTDGPWGDFRAVTPGYFETMGIPLKSGRTFDEGDIADGRRVAVIDEVLARKYWPNQSALGKRVGFQGRDSTRWLEVVGVVGHVMQNSPKDDEHTQLYQVFSQAPFTQMGIAVRTRAEPLELVPAVRRLVLSLDPQQPIFDIQPMEERVSGSSAQPRFLSLLLSLFAGVAATLAAVGIYGVMSYTVAQQTRELGIRLALGAETRSVLRLVLGKGLVLAGLGVGLGVAGAFALGKLLTSQLVQVLFQTRLVDPIVFGGVAVGLLAVAAAATWVPARRATRVDPIVALRAE